MFLIFKLNLVRRFNNLLFLIKRRLYKIDVLAVKCLKAAVNIPRLTKNFKLIIFV